MNETITYIGQNDKKEQKQERDTETKTYQCNNKCRNENEVHLVKNAITETMTI